MALEPPIRTLADLQRAVDAQMKDQIVALERLREIQKLAAKQGIDLTFRVERADGRTVSLSPPRVDKKATPGEVAAREVAPPGVHFADGIRVGDETRREYYEHLHEMFAGGFISQDELDARLDAMLACSTENELKFLICDLPAKTKKEKEAPQEKKEVAARPRALDILVSRFNWLAISVLLLAVTLAQLQPGSLVAFLLFSVLSSAAFAIYVLGEKKRK